MDFFTNRIRVGENVSIENLLVLLIVIKRAFREVKIEEKVCVILLPEVWKSIHAT